MLLSAERSKFQNRIVYALNMNVAQQGKGFFYIDKVCSWRNNDMNLVSGLKVCGIFQHLHKGCGIVMYSVALRSSLLNI
ncbi:hypothetical protein D3C73_1201300 [compost metagenome]